MKNIELLDLIAKGKTEDLLLKENLTLRLNNLSAIGLIDICEGKILITQKGKMVQETRALKKLEIISSQKDIEDFSSTSKRNSRYMNLGLVLICSAAVLLFLFILSGFQ